MAPDTARWAQLGEERWWHQRSPSPRPSPPWRGRRHLRSVRDAVTLGNTGNGTMRRTHYIWQYGVSDGGGGAAPPSRGAPPPPRVAPENWVDFLGAPRGERGGTLTL